MNYFLSKWPILLMGGEFTSLDKTAILLILVCSTHRSRSSRSAYTYYVDLFLSSIVIWKAIWGDETVGRSRLCDILSLDVSKTWSGYLDLDLAAFLSLSHLDQIFSPFHFSQRGCENGRGLRLRDHGIPREEFLSQCIDFSNHHLGSDLIINYIIFCKHFNASNDNNFLLILRSRGHRRVQFLSFIIDWSKFLSDQLS